MSSTLNSPPRRGASTALGLRLFVAGALLVGGLAGLIAHRVVAGTMTPGARAGTMDAPGTRQETILSLAAVGDPELPRGVAPLRIRVRPADVVPPDDPFRPSRAEPLAALPAGAGQAKNAGTQVPAFHPAAAPGPAVTPERSPAPAARPERAVARTAAPALDGVTLVGIIQGEPPVALLRSGGQSLFLKVGDQLAGTWRLAEIKERSAVLELGDHRVEIPIQGGNSQ